MKKKILFEKEYELNFEELYYKVEKFIHGQVNKFYNVQNHVTDKDDLFQTACLSLDKAFKSYDINKGIKFLTYYSFLMQNDILMLNRKIVKERSTLLESSLEYQNNEGDVYSIFDYIPSDYNVEEECLNSMLISDILKDLKDFKFKDIILDIADGKSQHSVAIKYNMSQSYVSRIYKKYIKEQKEKLKKKDLLDLKPKEIKRYKGENDMARLNEDQLKRYLLNNANDDISVSNLIKKYCDKYNIPQSTVFTALTKRMPVFYDRIKAMCKKSLTEKNSKVNYSVIVNVEDAKEFLKDKVENEKYSLNKALQEYSKIVNVSISTIRNHIIREDKEFMEKIKASSLANISDQYKAIAVNNKAKEIDIETSKENNIMPVDIVNNPFDPYEDLRKPIILTENELLPITKNNEDELISLLKDLKEAKVSFDGKLFSYSIGNCGIKICDQDGRVVSNGIMHLEDIENLINELEKVAKITKSLF